MPVGLNETPVGFVDPQCPVAWEHPLNRGLVCGLNLVPNSGWRGGLKFRDASRGSKLPNDGTLANGTSWVNGKYIQFDGTNDIVSLASALSGTILSVVFSLDYTDAGDGVVIGGADNGAGGADYAPYIDSPSGNIYYRPGGNGAGAVFVSVANGGLTSGTFYHIAIVRNGTSVSFYKNGKQLSTTQTLPANGTGSINTFGNFSNGGAPFSGRIGFFRYYSIPLSSANVALLYREYMRGNPETLRWVGSTTYGFAQQAAPATGGTPIFNSGILSSRIISGGGIVA